MGKRATAKNSILGLLSQLVMTVFAFITRSVLIKYVGIDILGLNSTFASVLSALSLAEMGFQTAIVYSLYKPLYENDINAINDILNIFKIVYRFIGFFFILASILIIPFLKYIINGIDVNATIIVFFLLQSSASAASYFLAYKRALLYADQKDYISKTVDIITFLIFSIIEIFTLVLFKSYSAYLIERCIQVIVSNVIIQFLCSKRYKYLHSKKINKPLFRKIIRNVKDVFLNRIAGYIYTSTDSIVISAFINTTTVGFYANYMTIVSSLRLLTNALLHPIVPSIGNFLVSESNGEKQEELFYMHCHLRYIIALMTVIPMTILIDEFIIIWLGQDFLLSRLFVYLTSIDLYIHIVHSSTYDFINSFGLFNIDKYVEIIGAATNIGLSIILSKMMGVEGVLVGTVVGQIAFWIGRSALVYKKGFRLKNTKYLLYWIYNFIYIIGYIILLIINKIIFDSILSFQTGIVHFIYSAVIMECVILVGIFVLFGWKKEQKNMQKRIISYIKRKHKS
ncbi:MAG: oligosaccharide flippase family protein [Ruminococcus sp.]|nr:oligosaccharide flippase family protein [Ruminococcus sp.]